MTNAHDQKFVIPAMTVASSWSRPANERLRVVQAWNFDFIDCSNGAQLTRDSFFVHKANIEVLVMLTAKPDLRSKSSRTFRTA